MQVNFSAGDKAKRICMHQTEKCQEVFYEVSEVAEAGAAQALFPVPNEIFILGLSPGEIAVYCYLLRTEDRQTFQCYPSYEAIGKAVGVSRNTVAKYVRSLEEKGLIRTEPTVVRSKDGRLLNGNRLYTICPIQAAVEAFYERQLSMAGRQHIAPLNQKGGETVC